LQTFDLAHPNNFLADHSKTPRQVGLSCPARQVTSQFLEAMSQRDIEAMSQRDIIAIVDDDAGIRDALEQLLTARGYCVELYSCGEEFIRAATFSAATCLLVDIQLGDISGVELGRHLAASGFMFPIIFMTGSQDELTRTQAVKFGCVAYLQKPLKAAELNEAISLAIGKSVRK
jgi:FixJ family two-component response regulator